MPPPSNQSKGNQFWDRIDSRVDAWEAQRKQQRLRERELRRNDSDSDDEILISSHKSIKPSDAEINRRDAYMNPHSNSRMNEKVTRRSTAPEKGVDDCMFAQ